MSVLLLMTELQLQGFLTLLQLHQALRQGCDGLRKVLSRACDPEGNGSSHARTSREIWTDDNTWLRLSQDQTETA